MSDEMQLEIGLYPIPAGTPLRRCGCCGAQIVTVTLGKGVLTKREEMQIVVTYCGGPFPQRGPEHGVRCKVCSAQICCKMDADFNLEAFNFDGTPHRERCTARDEIEKSKGEMKLDDADGAPDDLKIMIVQSPGKSRCAHPRCKKLCHENYLACREHWFELPETLRAEVWRSHRAGDRAAHLAAVRRCFECWLAELKKPN